MNTTYFAIATLGAFATGLGLAAVIIAIVGRESEETPRARRLALGRAAVRARADTPAPLSAAERERLVDRFRRKFAEMPHPPTLGPSVHANLMANNTPSVARKLLEDEGLLDEQAPFGDAA